MFKERFIQKTLELFVRKAAAHGGLILQEIIVDNGILGFSLDDRCHGCSSFQPITMV